jgi:hypothetical protein
MTRGADWKGRYEELFQAVCDDRHQEAEKYSTTSAVSINITSAVARFSLDKEDLTGAAINEHNLSAADKKSIEEITRQFDTYKKIAYEKKKSDEKSFGKATEHIKQLVLSKLEGVELTPEARNIIDNMARLTYSVWFEHREERQPTTTPQSNERENAPIEQTTSNPANDRNLPENSFLEGLEAFLDNHVLDSGTFDDKATSYYQEYHGLNINSKDVAVLRNYVVNKQGVDNRFFQEFIAFAEAAAGRELTKQEQESLQAHLAGRQAKTDFQSPSAPISTLAAPNEHLKESSLDEEGGLFFYTWWAFKNEETIQYLNNNSRYPRNIGKGSVHDHQEKKTKEKDVIENNDKPEGVTNGLYLGMGGTTKTEIIFTNQETIPEATLREYPLIGLGAAIAPRSVREQIGGKKLKIANGHISDDDSQALYELTNKEELRWKWYWQGKPEDKPPENIIITGRVVDADKVETLLGIDLITAPLQQLTQQQIQTIMDRNNKLGFDKNQPKVQYAISTAKEKELGTTDSDGFFHHVKAPTNTDIKYEATRTKSIGYDNKSPGISVNPHPPGTPVNANKDYAEVIIPLKEKQPTPPVNKFVITSPEDRGEEHKESHKPLFGRKEIFVIEENVQHGVLTFQSFKTLPKEPYLLVIITKLNNNYITVERNNPLTHVEDVFITKDVCEATWTHTYALGKKIIGTINIASEVPKNTHQATTDVTIKDTSKLAEGAYRIWCIALKGNYLINDLSRLTVALQETHCYDFNYIDFAIGTTKTTQKNVSASISPEKALKEAETSIEKLIRITEHKRPHKTVLDDPDLDFSFLWTDGATTHIFEEIKKDIIIVEAKDENKELHDMGKAIHKLLDLKVAFDKSKGKDKAKKEALIKHWDNTIKTNYLKYLKYNTGRNTFTNFITLLQNYIKLEKIARNK